MRFQRSFLGLGALLFLLSGCLGGTDPSEGPNVAPECAEDALLDCDVSEPLNVTKGALDVVIFHYWGSPGYSDGEQGGNCIVVSPEDLSYVRNGTFVARWDVDLVGHEELRLSAWDFVRTDPYVVAGPSPLELRFDEIVVERFLELAVTPLDRPDAMLNEQVRLEWYLVHDGPADLPYVNGSCDGPPV